LLGAGDRAGCGLEEGVSAGDVARGLPGDAWPSSQLSNRGRGKINSVEKCPLASKARGRTPMNGAPGVALPRLVCGLTPRLVFGNTGACESNGERQIRWR